MGKTYRHDNKDSWSKPKFKRNKKQKNKTSSRSLEEYDSFDSKYEKKGLNIIDELAEDLEDYES